MGVATVTLAKAKMVAHRRREERGALVDVGVALGDGFGIGLATRVAALAALGLGQDGVDLFDQRVAFDLETDGGIAQCRAEHEGDAGHDEKGCEHVGVYVR
jgi:hypothetical protein